MCSNFGVVYNVRTTHIHTFDLYTVYVCVRACVCMHAWSWHYGKTGHQITDVRGRLRTNVGYRPLFLSMYKILGKSVVIVT